MLSSKTLWGRDGTGSWGFDGGGGWDDQGMGLIGGLSGGDKI